MFGGGLRPPASGNAAGPQALDLLRAIDGQPLERDELAAMLGCAAGAVESFSCPESSAVRYKQSVAGRVFLTPSSQGAVPAAGAGSVPPSVFHKRAVLRELPYALQKAVKPPFKIGRDVRSNRIEAAFLNSALLRGFCEVADAVQVLMRSPSLRPLYPFYISS